MDSNLKRADFQSAYPATTSKPAHQPPSSQNSQSTLPIPTKQPPSSQNSQSTLPIPTKQPPLSQNSQSTLPIPTKQPPSSQNSQSTLPIPTKPKSPFEGRLDVLSGLPAGIPAPLPGNDRQPPMGTMPIGGGFPAQPPLPGMLPGGQPSPEQLRQLETQQMQKNALKNSVTVFNSEIPNIRANLTSKGIDGRGVKVAVLEGVRNPPSSNDLPPGIPPELRSAALQANAQSTQDVNNHRYHVASVINDAEVGVAPGAEVLHAGFNEGNPTLNPDNIKSSEDLAKELTKGLSSGLNGFAGELDKLADQEDPALKVVNLSTGGTHYEAIDGLLNLAGLKKPDGSFLHPNLGQILFSGDPELLYPDPAVKYDPQKMGVLANRVYNRARGFMLENVYNSTEYKQALAKWEQSVKQASDKGISVVMSAANNGDSVDRLKAQGIQVPPEDEFNDYAKNPYVISVGASNSQFTPGDLSDDRTSRLSSQGDSRFHPTVVAPGEGILTKGPRLGPALSGMPSPAGDSVQSLDGTSFSAPYVSGVIAMMLQQDPTLTPVQIRERLTKTAMDTRDPVEADGAGVVDPVKAVTGSPGNPSFQSFVAEYFPWLMMPQSTLNMAGNNPFFLQSFMGMALDRLTGNGIFDPNVRAAINAQVEMAQKGNPAGQTAFPGGMTSAV
jgi:subtilisin family serine protease